MKWLLNLINFFKTKEKTLADDLSKFETVAPQIYARLKGYNFSVVMIWAFGANWSTIGYSQLVPTFIKLHPEFRSTNPQTIIINSILDIIDLYGTTSSNKNG